MAIELEKHHLRSYEIRKQKYKKRMKIVSIISVIVILGVVAFITNMLLNKNYTGYEVINSIERNDSSSAKYLSYKSGILRYSRDGAVAISGSGNQIWNGTYQMKEPIVDISGDFVSISDRGYKTVQIFDEKGSMTTVEVLHPIITTEIADQGVIAVLMEGDDAYYISFYDNEGKQVLNIRTIAQKDGFPIDIALSNDGRKLATSYVSLTNGTLQGKVTFYNFGGVGQSYVDKVVGGFDYGQTLVADIEFLDNDTVAAFGDNKFSIYTMKELPELVYEEEITTEIKTIIHNDQYVGLVLNTLTGDNKYSVVLYDLQGKKVLEKPMNYEYENIFLSKNEIIMYSGQEWIIWRSNGKEKLQYSFASAIAYILPSDNSNKYIIVKTGNIEEVSLTDQ